MTTERLRFSLRGVFLVVSVGTMVIALATGHMMVLVVLFCVAAVVAVLGMPLLILLYLGLKVLERIRRQAK